MILHVLYQLQPWCARFQCCRSSCVWLCGTYVTVVHHFNSTDLPCAPSTCIVHHRPVLCTMAHKGYQFFRMTMTKVFKHVKDVFWQHPPHNYVALYCKGDCHERKMNLSFHLWTVRGLFWASCIACILNIFYFYDFLTCIMHQTQGTKKTNLEMNHEHKCNKCRMHF